MKEGDLKSLSEERFHRFYSHVASTDHGYPSDSTTLNLLLDLHRIGDGSQPPYPGVVGSGDK